MGRNRSQLLLSLVMLLMESYLDADRILCTDIYTNGSVIKDLSARQTHFVGTLKKDRTVFHNEVTDPKLERGQVKSQETFKERKA